MDILIVVNASEDERDYSSITADVTQTHTHTIARTHVQTHTHTHIYTHTHTPQYAHTHTHTTLRTEDISMNVQELIL